MKEVVGVTFEEGKIYYFDPNEHKLKENVTVIVETEQGLQFGTVKIPLMKIFSFLHICINSFCSNAYFS